MSLLLSSFGASAAAACQTAAGRKSCWSTSLLTAVQKTPDLRARWFGSSSAALARAGDLEGFVHPGMNPGFARTVAVGRGSLLRRRNLSSQPPPVPPPPGNCDQIGPPDKTSHLRPVWFHVPEGESDLHRRYRTLRQDTIEWSHQFWKRHNLEFSEERDRFIEERLSQRKAHKSTDLDRVTADEMSEFYKDFLNRKWKDHLTYNWEWQKRNFSILGLSVLVSLENAISVKKN